MAEWKSPFTIDTCWMMYSANYLFHTRGVRWAIDPLRLKQRLPEAIDMNYASDLKDLDFVLLTHRHGDHLDLELLRSLRHLPIQWVVPEFLLTQVQEQANLPEKQIIIPSLLQTMQIGSLCITPFNGLHWEQDKRGGVPAIGYLVEAGEKRWSFPGDTRRFEARALPDFGAVDVLFAHLWLGKHCARMNPPLLVAAFAGFCLALQPKRLVITHLQEYGRQADDLWEQGHVQLVREWLAKQSAHLPVEAAFMGARLEL